MISAEAIRWLDKFRDENLKSKEENKEIIVCTPFTLLSLFKDYKERNGLKFELGAQDISRFPQGPYTGEINGAQIKDFANYVLVGHSERRGSFGEDESVIHEKIKMAIDYNLTPILFVQSKETPIPQGVDVVVYEPPSAISTVSGGVPDNSIDVTKAVEAIRKKYSLKYVLYGGSVDSNNVSNFTKIPEIDGVVPGRASLDPVEFFKIIKNA